MARVLPVLVRERVTLEVAEPNGVCSKGWGNTNFMYNIYTLCESRCYQYSSINQESEAWLLLSKGRTNCEEGVEVSRGVKDIFFNGKSAATAHGSRGINS
jgi:hypothetical protein